MKKKIIVRAPALTQSGYGEQARFALRSLRAHEDKFDIFNIATGDSITAMEIAKIFLKIDNTSKIKIKKINQTTNHFFYDISKATKKLKFKPKIKVTQKMIESWLDDSSMT